MKTQINQASVEFKPIDITIRLETAEELKQFLLLTSALSDSDSYADSLPIIVLPGNDRATPRGTRLAEFVETMISGEQWRTLADIYANGQVS